MEQYKIHPEGIRQIRNQSLKQSVPLTLLAVAVGCFMSYPNFNSSLMLFFIPFMIGFVGFGIYKGVGRLEQLFGSYTLIIDENTITREQFNTPTIKIPFTSIASIDKNQSGSFTINGANSVEKIIVPPQVENIGKLEEALNRIKKVTFNSPSFFDKYRVMIAILNLVCMVILFTISNKTAVALSGILLLAINGWSAFVIFQSKNIDRKTKKSMYWIIPLILAVIFTMYYKLSH